MCCPGGGKKRSCNMTRAILLYSTVWYTTHCVLCLVQYSTVKCPVYHTYVLGLEACSPHSLLVSQYCSVNWCTIDANCWNCLYIARVATVLYTQYSCLLFGWKLGGAWAVYDSPWACMRTIEDLKQYDILNRLACGSKIFFRAICKDMTWPRFWDCMGRVCNRFARWRGLFSSILYSTDCGLECTVWWYVAPNSTNPSASQPRQTRAWGLGVVVGIILV